MVTTGAAVGAGAWVAPSIFTFDRAYAAIGSCGTKPLQVDWSRWRNQNVPVSPSNFAANDGVTVTMSIADPDNVQDNYWDMRVFGGTINGRRPPAITGMSGANNGQGVTVTFTFSTPVQPSFFLIDIDGFGGSWIDYVEVLGYLAGGTAIDPNSMTPGGAAVAVVTPSIVVGQFSSSSSNSEAEVDFQSPIDTLTIHHYDDTNAIGFQWIGVHDLHWC